MENYFGKLGGTQEEALAKAEPIVAGILKAQDEGDYEAFCSFFEGPLAQNVSKADFQKNQQHIVSTMGTLKEKMFVTSMKRADLIGLVYKCKFTETDDDFMVTITINDNSDPIKSTGIWIS